MASDWPGEWFSKVAHDNTDTGEVSYVNDNGIRCLFGDEAEAYLYMEDVPPSMEARR